MSALESLIGNFGNRPPSSSSQQRGRGISMTSSDLPSSPVPSANAGEKEKEKETSPKRGIGLRRSSSFYRNSFFATPQAGPEKTGKEKAVGFEGEEEKKQLPKIRQPVFRHLQNARDEADAKDKTDDKKLERKITHFREALSTPAVEWEKSWRRGQKQKAKRLSEQNEPLKNPVHSIRDVEKLGVDSDIKAILEGESDSDSSDSSDDSSSLGRRLAGLSVTLPLQQRPSMHGKSDARTPGLKGQKSWKGRSPIRRKKGDSSRPHTSLGFSSSVGGRGLFNIAGPGVEGSFLSQEINFDERERQRLMDTIHKMMKRYNETKYRADNVKAEYTKKSAEAEELKDKVRKYEKRIKSLSKAAIRLEEQYAATAEHFEQAVEHEYELATVRSRLKRENRHFDPELQQLQKEQKRQEEMIAKVQEAHNEAVAARDAALNSLALQAEAFRRDSKSRKREMSLMRKELEEKKRLDQTRNERKKQRSAIVLSALGDLDKEQEEALKHRSAGMMLMSGFTHLDIEKEKERYERYLKVFERVQTATGMSDIGGIIERFKKRDQTHRRLQEELESAKKMLGEGEAENKKLQQALSDMAMESHQKSHDSGEFSNIQEGIIKEEARVRRLQADFKSSRESLNSVAIWAGSLYDYVVEAVGENANDDDPINRRGGGSDGGLKPSSKLSPDHTVEWIKYAEVEICRRLGVEAPLPLLGGGGGGGGAAMVGGGIGVAGGEGGGGKSEEKGTGSVGKPGMPLPSARQNSKMLGVPSRRRARRESQASRASNTRSRRGSVMSVASVNDPFGSIAALPGDAGGVGMGVGMGVGTRRRPSVAGGRRQSNAGMGNLPPTPLPGLRFGGSVAAGANITYLANNPSTLLVSHSNVDPLSKASFDAGPAHEEGDRASGLPTTDGGMEVRQRASGGVDTAELADKIITQYSLLTMEEIEREIEENGYVMGGEEEEESSSSDDSDSDEDETLTAKTLGVTPAPTHAPSGGVGGRSTGKSAHHLTHDTSNGRGGGKRGTTTPSREASGRVRTSAEEGGSHDVSKLKLKEKEHAQTGGGKGGNAEVSDGFKEAMEAAARKKTTKTKFMSREQLKMKSEKTVIEKLGKPAAAATVPKLQAQQQAPAAQPQAGASRNHRLYTSPNIASVASKSEQKTPQKVTMAGPNNANLQRRTSILSTTRSRAGSRRRTGTHSPSQLASQLRSLHASKK